MSVKAKRLTSQVKRKADGDNFFILIGKGRQALVDIGVGVCPGRGPLFFEILLYFLKLKTY